MIYDELMAALGIGKGERVYLSSELVRLSLMCRKRNEMFDVSKLIDYFQQAVGNEGTLIIPTFSYDFSQKHYYDYARTKGVTGVLGNTALERGDFIRTSHPMHSFAVWGKDRELLASMDNRHSFGNDSPFAYCRTHHARQLILGTDYAHAFSFVHYAETVCGVPYRHAKQFTGTYVCGDGREETRTYDYAARNLDIQPEERFNRIGKILEDSGAAEKADYGGYACRRIDLAASYRIICRDIINNQCRNLYDFSIPRKDVFRGWKRG